MFAEERKQTIVDLINSQKKVTVQELSERFGASGGTIRNDLRELEERGLLKRTHGGAITLDRSSFERGSAEKEVMHYAAKLAIARKALELIDDGDTIALDTGTTTMELARLLGSKKDLLVVTNDLEIALEAEKHDGTTVVLTGGTLRRLYHCTIGPQAAQQLHDLRVDKTFLAANGISVEAGITTPNIDLADIKRKLIDIAKETILLGDSSKIGRVSFKRVAGLQEISLLLTDSGLSATQQEKLREAGVCFLMAEP
jgi:DeoR family fructose operon transcriptional repressor